jgi:CheY-like chemotaxis protein
VKNNGNHSSCSVLLVEDNKINQKLVQLMLSKFDLEAAIAESGQQAVDMAKAEHYDLILMDLHMPGMDGVEATQILKSHFGEACPPIVALTADAMAGSEAEAMEQGLDGYLVKPINTATLRQCISEHTGKEL